MTVQALYLLMIHRHLRNNLIKKGLMCFFQLFVMTYPQALLSHATPTPEQLEKGQLQNSLKMGTTQQGHCSTEVQRNSSAKGTRIIQQGMSKSKAIDQFLEASRREPLATREPKLLVYVSACYEL